MHEEHHIHLHFHADELLQQFFKVSLHEFRQLTHKVDSIMASNAELQQALTDLGTQLDKVKAEIVKKIADLEAAISAGGTTPEVDAALAALKGKVQELDDLNPDAPTP